MCKLVLHVKQKLDELDDLLNADSAIFSNTRWKVSTKVMLSQFNFRHAFISSPNCDKLVLSIMCTALLHISMSGETHVYRRGLQC
uniref:Uncharacterized protein n=1 Tax=Aegilops tauschii subsp. strangulata TaxID=200361 RepID=A0A453KEL6_AEGTS